MTGIVGIVSRAQDVLELCEGQSGWFSRSVRRDVAGDYLAKRSWTKVGTSGQIVLPVDLPVPNAIVWVVARSIGRTGVTIAAYGMCVDYVATEAHQRTILSAQVKANGSNLKTELNFTLFVVVIYCSSAWSVD